MTTADPCHAPRLSAAELRVALLVAEGMTNPQIAERLFLSRRTVQTHVQHAFEKLGMHTRLELALYMLRSEHAAVS